MGILGKLSTSYNVGLFNKYSEVKSTTFHYMKMYSAEEKQGSISVETRKHNKCLK